MRRADNEPITWRSLKRFELAVLVWLMLITGGVTVAIIKVEHEASARSAEEQAGATQSEALCQRSIEFAPALGVFFLKVHALTPAQDKAYTQLLPQKC